MKPNHKQSIIGVLVLSLLALHHLSTHKVNEIRTSIRYQNQLSAPLVPDTVLKIIAGEFKGAVTDYLLLEIGAFIDAGEDKNDADWERVTFHFGQCMALDPHFEQTYRMVQAFLPWKGKAEEANAFLKKAARNRPWDWYPTFFIGFNYFHFLKDYAKASENIIAASKYEDAPPVLATLGARLAQKSGQTLAALVFLKSMEHNPDYDENAKKLIALRIKVLEGALRLEKAIAAYRQRFGHDIESLQDLVASGILKELPQHAELGVYTYSDGKVRF
jgi:tetratricopeptide (TPR) repeat protein